MLMTVACVEYITAFYRPGWQADSSRHAEDDAATRAKSEEPILGPPEAEVGVCWLVVRVSYGRGVVPRFSIRSSAEWLSASPGAPGHFRDRPRRTRLGPPTETG